MNELNYTGFGEFGNGRQKYTRMPVNYYATKRTIAWKAVAPQSAQARAMVSTVGEQ